MEREENVRLSELLDFSELYTSDEMAELLSEGKRRIKEDKKIMRKATIVMFICIIAVIIILFSKIYTFFAVIPVVVFVIYLTICMGKTTYYEYYKNTIMPFIVGKLDMKIKFDNQEVLNSIGNRRFTKLNGIYDNTSCFKGIELTLKDSKKVHMGIIKLTKRVKDNKSNTVKIETVFRGLAIRIPMNLDIGGVITITYDGSVLFRHMEGTMRSVIKQKKVFEFTNSELEKYFDCTVVSNKGEIDVDKIVKGVKNIVKGFKNEEIEPIIDEESDRLNMIAHDIVSSSVEEMLIFMYKNYGPFNMILDDTGICFEIFEEGMEDNEWSFITPKIDAKIRRSVPNKVIRILSGGKAGKVSNKSHCTDYLNFTLDEKGLMFDDLNNNFELFALIPLLDKYFNPEASSKGVNKYDEDFEYFDRILGMKQMKEKEINAEYKDYFESL